MVLAIPVLLFFGAPFYAGAWKGTRSGRNNIDRLVALTTSVAFLFSVFNTFFPDYWLGIGLEPHVYYGVAAVIIAFSLTGEFMEELSLIHILICPVMASYPFFTDELPLLT